MAKRPRRHEVTDPSPNTIRQRSEAIRDSWNTRQRAKRAGIKESAWMPPRVHLDELRDVNSENEMAG